MLRYLLMALVVLAVAGYLFYVYKKLGKKAMLAEIRKGLYAGMLTTEKKCGPNAGDKKFAFLIAHLYDFVAPELLKKFISGDEVKLFVQKEYDKYYAVAKDYLDDGQVNGSVNTAPPEAPKEINPTGQVTNTEKL
ncbi:MAG: hypothetical protein QME45_10750 [Clostridiales bacterium]|nr:hypothetical protein [Clostridiales bacterium]